MEETSPVRTCSQRLQERIDLVVVAEERRKAGGLSVPIAVSVALHLLLVVWFIRSYDPLVSVPENVPTARFVELMRQQAPDFVEAPGPEVERAPANAPFSDKNRKASTPEPTGPEPTQRPGDGAGLYTPPSAPPGSRGPSQPAVAPSPAAMQAQHAPSTATTSREARPAPNDDTFTYREPVQAAAFTLPNLKEAIATVGRDAARGGPDGTEGFGPAGGGEQGRAEQGPLSFETQWYPWGDYAQSMVNKIRLHWYANMPQLIRTGLKGVVTIRFTIQRDGRITDITILESSGAPPYDHGARKAIELSSPLKPLPADFPHSSERVICMFYYNMEVPQT